MATQQERTMRAVNILAKWRVLFTGWQLGTRPKGDPEGDAVRDHRETTILLRAEVSALVASLRAKDVFTDEEWLAALELEAGLIRRPTMPEPTMHCHLCPEVTAMDAIVDHAVLMHPEVPQDVTWPDGQHQMVDTTEMAWEADRE